jgi:hypothetical protein
MLLLLPPMKLAQARGEEDYVRYCKHPSFPKHRELYSDETPDWCPYLKDAIRKAYEWA